MYGMDGKIEGTTGVTLVSCWSCTGIVVTSPKADIILGSKGTGRGYAAIVR